MKNTKGGSVFQVGKSYYTRAGRVVEVVKVDGTAVHGYAHYDDGKRKFKIWSADGRSTAKNRSPSDLTEAQVVTKVEAPVADSPIAIIRRRFDLAAIPGAPSYDNDADEDLVPAQTVKLPYRVKYSAEMVSEIPGREFYSPPFDSEDYCRVWANRRNYTVITVRRVEVY